MTTVVRPYRGISADDRRADRRARLKAACLDLIGSGGVVSITAEAVSARAGLTKRYFYESYTDRDALLYEVMDDFFVNVRTEILDALAAAEADAVAESGKARANSGEAAAQAESGEAPPSSGEAPPSSGTDAARRAHIVARVLIDYLHGDSRQARLYVEAAGQPTLQARREEAFVEYTRMLVDAFPADTGVAEGGVEEGGSAVAEGRSAIAGDGGGVVGGGGATVAGNAPRPVDTVTEQRRSIAGMIIVAGTTQAAITWLQGRIQLERDDVIAEIARLILVAMSPQHT